MVKIDVWTRLGPLEKIYTYIHDWKYNEEKIENILLKNATEEEKKVYQNIKRVEPNVLRNFAKSAVDKLDSNNWKVQAFGAGEINAFEEISCYIGVWVDNIDNGVWRRWMYVDTERPFLLRINKKYSKI